MKSATAPWGVCYKTYGVFQNLQPELDNGVAGLCNSGRLSSIARGYVTGSRQSLIAHGVESAVVIQGEADTDMTGGVERRTAALANAQFQLTLQGGPLLRRPADTRYLDVIAIGGENPSRFVGGGQGESNIAASPGIRVFEVWIQHNFVALRSSPLLGLYDVNSEFCSA